MTRFLLRRLAGLGVTLLVTSFVVYGSMALAPGGSESVLYGGRTPTPAVRAAVRAEYHLDEPFPQRYARWLLAALHGNFGISVAGHQPVSTRIGAAYATTLWLVGLSAILVVVVGIGLGLLAALGHPVVDGLVTLTSAISVGIPSFVAAALSIDIFALRLGWFPAYGQQPGLLGRLHSLVLPSVSLAIVAAALITRVTRATVRAELGRDYVLTIQARALPKRVLVLRHVLRNAAAPILATSGLQIASLLVGTVIVENAFGLPGLGSLLVSSVNQKDYPTVQAVTLIMVAAFVLTNLLVDLLQAAIDPRVRPSVTT
jgi:peptide/nickel transport system permease protein